MQKSGSKSFCFGGKAASVGVAAEAGVLAKINRFALKDLSADEVFVRKQLLCHNGVDRDNERFPESMLDEFSATLPGKNVLYFHEKRTFLPLGLYFDAATEVMPPEKFKELTGEEIRLPAGTSEAKVLWAWYYVVKTPDVESVLANIEGGVYRHWSIGFGAADLVGVKTDVNGPAQYYEYVSPGEAREGSLVWLGAQPGATSQKSAGGSDEPLAKPQGEKTMKTLVLLLGAMVGKSFGDTATEEQIAEAIKAAFKDKDDQIAVLQQEKAALATLAADGKSFRAGLIADYVRMKAALGEADADAAKQEGVKAFAAQIPTEMLQAEVKHLDARMREKFPGEQIAPNDPNANRGEGAGDDNPLLVKDGK